MVYYDNKQSNVNQFDLIKLCHVIKNRYEEELI